MAAAARGRGRASCAAGPRTRCWPGALLSALAGALAVLVLGLAALRAHPRAPFWPALLLAVAPGFVNLCHFATPESWLMLGAAATLAHGAAPTCAGARPRGRVGLVLGLTLSTKHTALALLAACLAAVWLAPRAARPLGRAPAAPGPGAPLVALGLARAGRRRSRCTAAPGESLAAHLRLRDARLLPIESARGLRARGWPRAAAARRARCCSPLAALSLRGPAWARAAGAARAGRSCSPAAAAGFFIGTPYALLDPPAVLSGMAFNYETRLQYKGLVGEATSFAAYAGLLPTRSPLRCWRRRWLGALVAAGRALRREAARAGRCCWPLVTPYLLVASSGHRALRFLAPAAAGRGLAGRARPGRARHPARGA